MIHLLKPGHLSAWLGLAIAWVLVWMPFSLQKGCARLIGKLLFHTSAKYRKNARINVQMCFPELTAQRREHICRQCFYYIILGSIVLATLRYAAKSRIRKRTVFHGEQYVRNALDKKQSVFLIGIHQAFLPMTLLVGDRFPTVMTFKPKSNVVWDDVLVRKVSSRYLEKMIESDSIRNLVKMFAQPRVYWIATDQDMRGKSSIFSTMFNNTVSSLTTLPRLARITPSVVLPFSILLGKDNMFHIHFSPAVNMSTDIHKAIANINKATEQQILRSPEQYSWIYRRFETQPKGAPSPYRN